MRAYHRGRCDITRVRMEDLGALFLHPGDLSDPIPSFLPIAIAVAAIAICTLVIFRVRIHDTVLTLGIVGLPLFAYALSNAALLDRSKNTDFCMSCHIMEPLLDVVTPDEPTLAAVHIRSGALPTYQSCYTCHSGYGLWGDADAKLAGVGHMVATLTGRYELPLKINKPFNIKACLACHAEGERFRAAVPHQVPDIQEALLTGEMGCTGTCHPAAHPPEALTGEPIR